MHGRRLRGERGITTVQVAILFPAVLFWLMLIVQYGLWWHGKQVANAAAADAVDAAQVAGGTEADGDRAARRFLGQSGNLTDVSILVERDADTVVAEVNGSAPRLVVGFDWSVAARSQAPVERYVPQDER